MPIQQTSTFNQATTPTVPGNFLSLFIAAARETTQEQGNLQSLVTRDTLPQGQGTTWNSPKFGSYTAQSLSQGADMVQQQAATSSNIVITPAEVGVQVLFTKKSLAQWTENMQVRAGRVMGQAMDRKIDADLGGLAASFTTYSLGSAGTVLSTGHIMAAVGALKGGNNTAGTAITAGSITNQVPAGPINATFRYETLGGVLKTLGGSGGTVVTTSTGQLGSNVVSGSVGAIGPSGSVSDEVFRSMYVTSLFNSDIYMNSNYAKDTSDDCVSMVFHKGAAAFINFDHDMAGGDVMIEEDASLRSIELNMVRDYGVGVLDQNYAVKMTFDAIQMTS